jgi:predicted deacylase
VPFALNFQRFNFGAVSLRFAQKGRAPSWLIHTGTHGDESGVNDSVQRFLEQSGDLLPDFLWVPEVSPSAVALGTRKNCWDHDVNRMFQDNSDDPEVMANLKLIKNTGFQVAIFFHEDLDRESEFYVYDSFGIRGDRDLSEMFGAMKHFGVTPFDGIDDPKCPGFSSRITDGYHSEVEDEARRAKFPNGDGTAMDYFGRKCLAGLRRLTPECPGKAKQAVKDRVAAEFFEYMIRWWYGEKR